MCILDFIKKRDSQRLLTMVYDITAETGRRKGAVSMSLNRLEQRELVIRTWIDGRRTVWTCSKSLALSYHRPVAGMELAWAALWWFLLPLVIVGARVRRSRLLRSLHDGKFLRQDLNLLLPMRIVT